MNKKKKIILISVLSAVLFMGIATAVILKWNKYSLVLNIPDDVIELEYGTDKLPKIKALCKGTLLNKKGHPVKVSMKENVDLKTLGEYKVTFTGTYMGNTLSAKRTFRVIDTVPPKIELVAADDYYTDPTTPYVEEGFTATDNHDGDITNLVERNEHDGKVTYTVSDSSGNTATAERTIRYKDITAPVNKTIYLTFDDGPGAYTARLLNILDKYNAKATFFVTNQFPSYQYMIGETHKRGHTIALHTLSHNYSKLYSSEDAYYQDLAGIRDIVIAQTGVTPTIVRFPGGTNNTVSRKYCPGIMTALSQSLSRSGYLYCDWNVSSGDAGGANTREKVYNNVITGIQAHDVSVVLQHDIKSHSVEAVEDILSWGTQNGYTFLAMDETTPMIHYKPQN